MTRKKHKGRKKLLTKKQFLYMKNDLSKIVNVMDELALRGEVHRIIGDEKTGTVFPGFDFAKLDKTYANTINLYNGMWPGYQKCNNAYHDLEHTMMIFLATARLLHGYQVVHGDEPKKRISSQGALQGLESSLIHEAGLQLKVEEDRPYPHGSTGAFYTNGHEERSKKFMLHYFTGQDAIPRDDVLEELNITREELVFRKNNILCTGLSQDMTRIGFSTYEEEVVSKIVGTADLLGQMSDPNYVYKLPYLFLEFVEAGILDYESPIELIAKHEEFHDEMIGRMDNQLGGMREYMRHHFREHRGIDRDLYHECIEINLKRSRRIGRNPERFFRRLSRNTDYNSRLSDLTRLEEDTKQAEQVL